MLNNSLTIRAICILTFYALSCSMSFAAETNEQVCFNFYILTKENANRSELKDFEIQKKLVLKQISQAQKVFEINQERHCPTIKFTRGLIKHIAWRDALKLSQPVDKYEAENNEQYLVRKLKEALDEIEFVINKVHDKPDMKYLYFKDLRADRAIYMAETALKNIDTHYQNLDIKNADNKIIKEKTENAIKNLKAIIDAYDKESSSDAVKKVKKRMNAYQQIDKASAASWAEGQMVLWNDIESQNTSVELKNLLKTYRSPKNQCLDVYIVPEARSPSTNVKENKKNGKWTARDGAAISSYLFPRATAGKGHAIILAYNSKPTEYRLAHEFTHLFLDKHDAHLNKKESDLMHEFSLGGSFLNEEECEIIKYNIKKFIRGNNSSVNKY